MEVVFFVLLGILSIIILLLFGIKFKVLALLHSKNKSAYYTLNHRFLSLVQGKVIILENGKVSVILTKNKILPKKSKEGFGSILGLEILKNLNISRLDVYIDNAKIKDAMTTALIGGGVKSVAGIISAILTNKKIQTNFHFSTSKENEDFVVAINLNVKISLLKFLIAYIKAKKKYNKNIELEESYAKN